jgi:hypothetical protein
MVSFAHCVGLFTFNCCLDRNSGTVLILVISYVVQKLLSYVPSLGTVVLLILCLLFSTFFIAPLHCLFCVQYCGRGSDYLIHVCAFCVCTSVSKCEMTTFQWQVLEVGVVRSVMLKYQRRMGGMCV